MYVFFMYVFVYLVDCIYIIVWHAKLLSVKPLKHVYLNKYTVFSQK